MGRRNSHDFCAWWGCAGHCLTFGGWILIQGIFLSIYSACLEKNLYKSMRETKNLVPKINCYFFFRNFLYFLHFLMYILQFGGYCYDMGNVIKDQKDGENNNSTTKFRM